MSPSGTKEARGTPLRLRRLLGGAAFGPAGAGVPRDLRVPPGVSTPEDSPPPEASLPDRDAGSSVPCAAAAAAASSGNLRRRVEFQWF